MAINDGQQGVSSGSYTIKEMKEDISYLKSNVKTMNQILRGEKDSAEPGGLIYSVAENSKFRKFAMKVLWLMFATVVGLLINQIIGLM